MGNTDLTFAYAIGIVALIILSYIGINYALTKKWINKQGVGILLDGLGLGYTIVKQLKFKDEDKIKPILEQSYKAVKYVNNTICSVDVNDKINIAYDYTLDLCISAKIELNDERKQLIKEIITRSFNSL